MKQNKKAQSAIEYIMLYGWAIFLILIVMITLLFSGMLDFIINSENTVNGFTTIKITRFDILTDGSFLFSMYNNADLELEIENIKFNEQDIGNVLYPFNILPGETIYINAEINSTYYPDEIIKDVPLEIEYTISGGDFVRSEIGFLSGKVI